MSGPNYAEIARRGAAAWRAPNPHETSTAIWTAHEAGRTLGRCRQPVPRRLTAAACLSIVNNPPAASRPPQEDPAS